MKKTWKFKVRPLRDFGAHLGIVLSDGSVAMVDHCDRYLVDGRNWTAHRDRNGVYAVGRNEGKAVRLHTLILGQRADHIDGNTLDNRRANLRPATAAENARNRRLASNNKSGLKGVSFRKDRGTWLAAIRVNGRLHKLGTFQTKEDAGASYDAAAIKYFAEFAVLNRKFEAVA